jgi:PAS domain S-box-containing protein
MPASATLQQLQQITDAVPSLISYITAEERYAVANKAYLDWFGLPPDMVVGRTLREVLGEKAYSVLNPHVRRALAGESHTFDASLDYPSGRRVVRASYVPDRGADGVVAGFVALIVDISELKRLEEDLREEAGTSATLYRLGQMVAGEFDLERLVQAVTDAATELSKAQFGAFFYNLRNESGESYTLYTLSGAPRDAFSKFPMPRNTPIFEPTFRGTGVVRIDDVTTDPRYGRNPPYHGMPEGHLPVRSYLAVPVISRTGDVLGGLFLGHDAPGVFTERVESIIASLAAHAAVAIDNSRLFTALERQRQEAEATARAAEFLLESSRTLAASLDYQRALSSLASLTVRHLGDFCTIDVVEDGRFRRVAATHADPSRQRILDDLREFPPPTAPGSRLFRVATTQTTDILEVTPEYLQQHAQSERHLQLMVELGSTSVMTVALAHGGQTLGIITLGWTSARSYTESDRRTAEELAYRTSLALSNARLYAQASEASRLKDEFLAIVSHELRTPLNAMRGWTSLLRSMELDEAQRARALDVIDRNITAQTQLVEDLLDISRIVSGKMRLNVQPVDIGAAVQAAIDGVRPAASAREIRIYPVLDPDAGPIWGDPDRIQQIGWNLLSNAIKFTPRQGEVHVALRRADSLVELTVTDTGQGITAEFLPHVFDRFRQGDSTTTRPVGGLGLGLAIVRHLVELHGGSVEARSDGEGTGATFTVRLPVLVAEPVAEGLEGPPPIERRRVARVRLESVRVLCVDDDRETCEVLSLVLKNAGAEVRSAASASSAVVEFEAFQPHVVISDIEMPGEDGYSLLRQIRAADSAAARRTIAIAVTAYARREDRLRALSAGFQSHLPKPIEPAELLALVGSLLGK